MKLPSFQFYPGDWMKDPNLSRASLQAKGALIEILCLAFECEKRGVLKTGSHAWSVGEIARAMRGDTAENEKAVRELLEHKVLKKDRKRAIYSSRMCKDEKLRKVRREAGLKGGNPNLLNQNPNHASNQKPTPSSSASSSSSSIVNNSLILERNKLMQMMRENANHKYTGMFLSDQVDAFTQKYKHEKITNLPGLVKSWMNNLTKEAAHL
jgi:hypothetical protein